MKLIGRLKEYYSQVMDLPDAPTKIARGAALGIAMDFLPIPLISIPVAYVAARLVGGNGLAAALTATFFKWAVPFFYMLNMATGMLLFDVKVLEELEPAVTAETTPVELLDKVDHLGYPFLAGAAINALLAGLVLYFIVRQILLFRQRRKGII